MNARDSSINIVSLFVFTIIFSFLMILSVTLVWIRAIYICCSMKVHNNNPPKYIIYSSASYHLSLMRSGI